MREIRTSGLTSGDGKRGVAAWPKPPRPSSTLQMNHDQRLFLRSLLQALRTGLYNLFGTPAHQQPEQVHLAWFELLQRMALDPWNNASDEPARLAHLNHRNDRAVLLQGSEGPA